MKTLVIGLDCAAPEILLELEGLPNFRRLMDGGCFGRLESVIPPITVPAWMCMSTSQDPGSLGIYGFRNRTDNTYKGLGVVNANSIKANAIWDILTKRGLQTVVVAVPPSYPPRKTPGVHVGCFLTPDTKVNEYTSPPGLKQEIQQLVGDYPVDAHGFRTDQKDWLLEQIYDMSRKHFQVIRYLMSMVSWDYLQFVEIGLDRIQHGFWSYHDQHHRKHVPGNRFQNAINDYYKYLDGELGTLLELIDEEETNVLVVSDHGAQRLDGGFCVNEWLCREGLLVLKEPVTKVTPFSPALVDWSKTKVWSEGGYYARVFVNVKGREPEGTVDPSEYEDFLLELRAKFEALLDDLGQPMGSIVFDPRATYKNVRNVPPDLIVHFGALYWRSIGGLGYETIYQQENDTGPDDCNHAQFGAFILNGPNLKTRGKVEGMRLLDIAPTLLDLMDVPKGEEMQGESLLKK